MRTPICYTVCEEDKIIANKLGIDNPHLITVTRELYDELYASRDDDGNPIFDKDGKLVYNNKNGQDRTLDLDNIDKKEVLEDVKNKLLNFREHNSSHAVVKMNSFLGQDYDAFKKLRTSYNSDILAYRVIKISNMFSNYVTDFKKDKKNERYKDVDRADIIKGFTDGEKKIGGPSMLFMGVYDNLVNELVEANEQLEKLDEGSEIYKEIKYKRDELRKMIDNFTPLASLAKKEIAFNEGVNIGGKMEYAEDVNPNDFGENDREDIEGNPEEDEKEAYMEERDKKSAFSSLGVEVKNALRLLYDVDKDGKAITDDIGERLKKDPAETHAFLQELLRNAEDEDDMINILLKNAEKHQWIYNLLDLLETNDEEEGSRGNSLKTQFFCDFKSGFQPYVSTRSYYDKQGNLRYVFENLNLNKFISLRRYLKNVAKGIGSDSNTIYDARGNVNKEAFINFRILYKDLFRNIIHRIETKNGIKEYTLYQLLQEEAKIIKDDERNKENGTINEEARYNRVYGKFLEFAQKLQPLFKSLGLNVSAEELAMYMTPEKIGESEVLKKISSQFEGIIDAIENSRKSFGGNYISLEKALFGQTKKNPEFSGMDQLSAMLRDFKSLRRNLSKMASAVRYADKKGGRATYYSDITPSYMADVIGNIKRYAENNDAAGLKQYLEDNFLCSSYFATETTDKDGNIKKVIYNPILKEIYEDCNIALHPATPKDYLSTRSYVAAMQMPSKFLGMNDKLFSRLSLKQDAISIYSAYIEQDTPVSEQIRNSKQYAYYPTFILGDSGARQYLIGKRYTEKQIIEFMVGMYHQEKNRSMLTEKFDEQYKDYSLIGTISKKIGHESVDGKFAMTHNFTLLPFLNEDKYRKLLFKDSNKKPISVPTEESVRNAITAYLNDYISEQNDYFAEIGFFETTEKQIDGKTETVYKHFNKEQISETKMREFYLNQKLNMISQIQLFGLDPAFYKGLEDMQKRYKQVYAGGRPLSLEARDRNGNLYRGDRRHQNVIYANDIELSSFNYNKDFEQMIIKAFGKDSFEYEKYKSSTLTDGQAFRSLPSYRAVLGMAGRWTDRMESAYNKIMEIRQTIKNENREINQQELDQIAELYVSFQPIKPFSFFHEKMKVGNDNMFIPVQHKDSEMPLIPELLPKDSKLRDLAEYMEANDIDLLAFDSAVKVGSFGAVDIGTVEDKNALHTNLKQAYVHQLDYSGYKIQGFYNEHNFSSRGIGSQVRKIGISKIDVNKDYTHYLKSLGVTDVNLTGKQEKLNGSNLLDFMNLLMSANMLDSFNGIKRVFTDNNLLSEMLARDIRSDERRSQNDLVAVAIQEGKPAMPYNETKMASHVEKTLASLFKANVQKQYSMGGSFIQASAFGINGYSVDGNLNCIIDVREDSNGNKYNMVQAETVVPFDIKYKDKNGNTVEAEYSDYCNEDGTLKMIKVNGKEIAKLERDFPGSTNLLAYRVPTENHYSIINCKIVRFTKRTEGGTIRLPLFTTTMAGFDFDIDKLYIMRKQFVEAKNGTSRWVKYDTTKPVIQNGSVARNNMLFELMRQRMMDEDTLSSRLKPQDFKKAKRAARVMRELKYNADLRNEKPENINGKVNSIVDNKDSTDSKPKMDYSNPSTLLFYNNKNQTSGDLVGVFAIQNINQIYSQYFERFELDEPISFAGKKKKNFIDKETLKSASELLANLLGASVDAVKEDALSDLNFNMITVNVGCTMARLGFDMEEIGYMLNQPIIQKLCKLCADDNLHINTAINQLKRDFFGVDDNVDAGQEGLSIPELQKAIIDYSSAISKEGYFSEEKNGEAINKRNQLNVLLTFEKLCRVSDNLSRYLNSTKNTSLNTLKSNAGSFYVIQQHVEDFEKQQSKQNKIINIVMKNQGLPVDNNKERIKKKNAEYLEDLRGNPFAFEQCMYDLFRKFLTELNHVLPYETNVYKQIRKLVQDEALYNLDEATHNTINSEVAMYLLSIQPDSEFNPNHMRRIKRNNNEWFDINEADYFSLYYGYKLKNFIEQTVPMLRSNFLIFRSLNFVTNPDKLVTYEDKEGNKYVQEVYDIRIDGFYDMSSREKDAIMDSILDIKKLNPGDYGLSEKHIQQIWDITKQLFLYNYHTHGVDYSENSLMRIFPVELVSDIKTKYRKFEDGDFVSKDVSYPDYFNMIQNEVIEIVDALDFFKNLTLNNIENSRFVRSIKKQVYEKHITGGVFEIDLTSKDLEKEFIKEVKDGEIIPVRTISVNYGDRKRYFMRDDVIGDNTSVKYKEIFPPESNGKKYMYMSKNENDNDNVKKEVIYSNPSKYDQMIEKDKETKKNHSDSIRKSIGKEAAKLAKNKEEVASIEKAVNEDINKNEEKEKYLNEDAELTSVDPENPESTKPAC